MELASLFTVSNSLKRHSCMKDWPTIRIRIHPNSHSFPQPIGTAGCE